jgi:hypothetical protein
VGTCVTDTTRLRTSSLRGNSGLSVDMGCVHLARLTRARSPALQTRVFRLRRAGLWRINGTRSARPIASTTPTTSRGHLGRRPVRKGRGCGAVRARYLPADNRPCLQTATRLLFRQRRQHCGHGHLGLVRFESPRAEGTVRSYWSGGDQARRAKTGQSN